MRRETVTQWIHKRDMPAHKVGRFWKFRITEIDHGVRAGGAAEGVNGLQQKAEADDGTQG